MNPDLIDSREEALALVDADLITAGDYVVLCRFKGWSPTGDPAPRASTEPNGRDTRFHREGADALRRPAQRPAAVVEISRRERSRPPHGQVAGLSIRNA